MALLMIASVGFVSVALVSPVFGQAAPPTPQPVIEGQNDLFETYNTLRNDLLDRNIFDDLTGTLADWRRAREMAVSLYGERHPEVALADSELAIEHFMAGRVEQVTPMLDDVLDILNTQADAYAARIEIVQQNLGVVALETGDGARALELITPMAERWLASEDPEIHSNGIAALGNIAQAHLLENQPRLGLKVNDRALRLARDANVLHRHPTLLNNRPLYLGMLGQDASAIRAARDGLAALAQMDNEDATRARAFLLSTLVTLLQQAGRHGEAIDVGREAVALSAKAQGEDAPVTAQVMLSLQSALYAQGRYEETIAVGEQINAIYDKAKMSDSRGALQSREYRARAALRLNPTLETLAAAREALESSGSLDQPLATEMFEAWIQFSRAEAVLLGTEAGLARLDKMEAALPDSLKQNDRIVGLLAARRALWTRGETRSAAIDLAYELALKADQDHQATLIASGLEARMPSRQRILLAETMQAQMEEGRLEEAFQLAQIFTYTGARVAHSRARLMQQTDRADLQSLFAERQALLADRAYVERRIQRAASGDDVDLVGKLEAEGKALSAKIATITSELDANLPGWRETETPTGLNFSDLKRRLGPHDRLLMPVMTGQGIALFAASPKRVDGAWLKIAPLHVAGLVDSVVKSVELSGLLRGRMPEEDQPMGAFDATSAAALHDLLMTPDVVSVLEGGETLHIVTNGALSRIPFSLLVTQMGLEDEADTYLIDQFALATLPSLAALSPDPAEKDGADQRFTDFIGMSAVAEGAPSAIGYRAGASDAAKVATANLPVPVDALPFAQDELDAISSVFDPRQRQLILGQAASETRLRSLKTGPESLLVLATHGFAELESQDVREPALVFARDDQNDGLVTATEVSGMRLPAGMVVLSACESGSPGYGLEDGLSGLASAFISAGAERVMVSHWPIRDDAAAFLTTRSLTALSEGRPAPHALRDAIKAFRARQDLDHAAHPALWASFSYVGG
jgi:CHAT domain-containing protein/tetratricopeptide (TPR) repeat protein